MAVAVAKSINNTTLSAVNWTNGPTCDYAGGCYEWEFLAPGGYGVDGCVEWRSQTGDFAVEPCNTGGGTIQKAQEMWYAGSDPTNSAFEDSLAALDNEGYFARDLDGELVGGVGGYYWCVASQLCSE